jgi:hypothetical protein
MLPGDAGVGHAQGAHHDLHESKWPHGSHAAGRVGSLVPGAFGDDADGHWTLFAGLDIAPVVSDTDVLLVTDRAQPEPTLEGIAWKWLEAVALDCTPPFRGLAVVSHADASHTLEAGIASYQPVTAQLRPERG